MKPGIKTTEFWLIIGTFALGLSKAVNMPSWAYPFLIAIYETSRAMVKYGDRKVKHGRSKKFYKEDKYKETK